MRKKTLSTLLCLCLFLCGCNQAAEQNSEPQAKRKECFAMNTYITLTAYGEDVDDSLNSAENLIRELESLWSVTDADSEIYQLNHSNGIPLAVSEPTAALIDFALEIAEKTNGALEPTIYPVLAAWGFTTDTYQVPAQEEITRLLQEVDYKRVQVENQTVILPDGMQLDMGSVAKGFASDQITELLRNSGVESAIVSFGGNIQVIGAKPDGCPWRIGIRNPEADGNFAVLEVSECAVVTSGGYQNYFMDETGKVYHHILDPQTGMPSESSLLSVTVVGAEGRLCDALSTALFVMGSEGASQYWRESGGFDMALYTAQGEVIITEGLEDLFSLCEGYENLSVTVLRK